MFERTTGPARKHACMQAGMKSFLVPTQLKRKLLILYGKITGQIFNSTNFWNRNESNKIRLFLLKN